MTVFDSPIFHQFMVCAMVGVCFGRICVALVQVPRWLVAMLTD